MLTSEGMEVTGPGLFTVLHKHLSGKTLEDLKNL